MGTFDENLHPREGDGRFATKHQSEAAVSLSREDEMLDSVIFSKPPETRNDLPDIGLTDEQWQYETGLGRRGAPGCDDYDTLANKYRAGALSEQGVKSQVESVENRFEYLPGWVEPEPTPIEHTDSLGFTRERFDELGGGGFDGWPADWDSDATFDWYRHNFGPRDAQAWSEADFTPHGAAEASRRYGRLDRAIENRDRLNRHRDESIAAGRAIGTDQTAWVKAGVSDPIEAKAWKDAQFGPVAAGKWHSVATRVGSSHTSITKFTPQQADLWRRVPDMTPTDAASWARQGYTPQEVFDRKKGEAATAGRPWEHGDWPDR